MELEAFNLLRLRNKPKGPVITYVKSDFEESALRKLGENAARLSSSEEYSVFSLTRGGQELVFIGTGSGSASVLSALFEVVSPDLTALVRIGACGGLNESKVGDIISCDWSFCTDRVSSSLAGQPRVFPNGDLSTMLSKALLGSQMPIRTGPNVSVDAMYLFEANVDQAERDHALCWDLETATVLAFGKKYGIRAGSVLEVVSDRHGNSSASYPPLQRLDYVNVILDSLIGA